MKHVGGVGIENALLEAASTGRADWDLYILTALLASLYTQVVAAVRNNKYQVFQQFELCAKTQRNCFSQPILLVLHIIASNKHIVLVKFQILD